MGRYFSGRYYKCQSDEHTLAVIPARHGKSRSIQLLTDEGAWNVQEDWERQSFGTEGIVLRLHTETLDAEGELTFGALTPIRYDIMGPFRYVPFMECRHSVVSMYHRVDGTVRINGRNYTFDHASGYIEGDRGYSFPSRYAWTHCFFPSGSLMLSVGEIPFGFLRFTGIIGIIWWQGKEYRLATYLGAKVTKITEDEITVVQGNYLFTAKRLSKRSQPLRAPSMGCMVRTIYESAACRAAYRFSENGRTLFVFTSDRASFEWEYGG